MVNATTSNATASNATDVDKLKTKTIADVDIEVIDDNSDEETAASSSLFQAVVADNKVA
jgi:hypothetical protein